MGELTMGAHSYGSPIRRGTMNEVKIGKYCSIAEGVIFDGGFSHNTRFISAYPFNHNWPACASLTGHPVCKGDIIVGNDVWIAEGAIIMSGVKIGDGAIVAARAFVTKDVNPYSIVGGTPAKLIRYKYDYETRRRMGIIKWWDWPEEKVIQNAKLLMSENIHEFIEKHYV